MRPLVESAWSRVQQNGLRTATPGDLLTVGICRNPDDAAHLEETSKEILKQIGSIRAFGDLSVDHLREVAGLLPEEAFRFLAILELGRRVGQAGKGDPEERMVYDAESIWRMYNHLRDEKREHFILVMLDAQNVVTRCATIHIGTLTSSIVGPREVFREAVREGASSVVVVHNHPSGDPTPSPEDVAVTEKLADVGRLLDIPLLDHVIIGERDFVSLRKRGVIR